METSTKKYKKEDGETSEDIPYAIKNTAREVERLATSIMEVNNILPEQVHWIDFTVGGDHGQGALQLGFRMTLVVTDEKKLEDPDDDDDKAITLESIVVEAICKKDNAVILKLTVNNSFVVAMQEMATGKLKMAMDERVKCSATVPPLHVNAPQRR